MYIAASQCYEKSYVFSRLRLFNQRQSHFALCLLLISLFRTQLLEFTSVKLTIMKEITDNCNNNYNYNNKDRVSV